MIGCQRASRAVRRTLVYPVRPSPQAGLPEGVLGKRGAW
jgi:hypothetical protein